MRVFAVALRDAAEAATGPTVFEVLAQTDALGRYRLEVPPGRYYIACGSVTVPTYYPGTTSVADARPVTIAAGAQVNGVDFADFVAPMPGSRMLLFGASIYLGPNTVTPFSTTVSGTIRLQDGTHAKGMEVRAVNVARPADIIRAIADDQGRYRLMNVVSGDYYIVSGTKAAPTFYPGVPDVANAVVVTVTSSGFVGPKDFVISGVVLRGRVAAASGAPAIGARIQIRSTPGTDVWDTIIDTPDGSYWVAGLSPGAYTVEASVPDAASQSLNVTVGIEPVKGVDFALPIAMVSGRILFEDGSPVPDARILGSAVLSNAEGSSILPVSGSGTFGSVMEPGEYKVRFPSIASLYGIKSIMAGTQDLLKGSLKVSTTESVTIEIRLEK